MSLLGPHRWMDVIEEVIGRKEERAPSPWDALAVSTRPDGGGHPLVLPGDVDLKVRLEGRGRDHRLPLPFVLTDNSAGRLSPHGRLALIRAAARTGCALRLPDLRADELELARELGVALWAVVGPRRRRATVEALGEATAVELQLVALAGGGGVERPVDAFDGDGSLARTVEVLADVSGGAPVLVNLGYGAEASVGRDALASGADGLLVQARTRWTPTEERLVGSDPPAAVSGLRRLVQRARRPDGARRPLLASSGGFKDGVEVAKALALGADLVILGTAPRIAIGCTLCGECGPGECPKRVLGTSPDAEGEVRDWRHESQRLVGYIGRVAEDARVALAQMGCASAGEATTDHLEALSYDAAATTGVALAGYGEPLPMWLH